MTAADWALKFRKTIYTVYMNLGDDFEHSWCFCKSKVKKLRRSRRRRRRFFDFYNLDFIPFFPLGYTWNKSDWFAWMWLTEALHPVHLHVCLVCRVMSRKSCIQVLKSEGPIPSFPSNSQNTQLLFLGLYEVTVATDTRGVNPASMKFVAERSQSFLPGSLQELPEV